MNARHCLLGVSLLSLAVCAGCATCCRPHTAPPAAVNVGVGIPAPPPAPVPVGVPGPAPVPAPTQQVPQPPPFPPAASNLGPQVAEWQDTWRPAAPQTIVQLSAPVPMGEGTAPRASLAPPEVSGQSTRPPEVSGKRETPRDRPSALPSGIPQFAAALDNRVTVGLKPLLDGLDWLQANGYRTVLKVRRPGEDDAAERRQVEQRGMKFVVLEVSPQTLNRQTLDEFVRLVEDAKVRPLFVYDRDGALAGGLWYLYYRVAERSSDEVARVRASALGLRDDQDGSHRDMWLAVQKLVSELK